MDMSNTSAYLLNHGQLYLNDIQAAPPLPEDADSGDGEAKVSADSVCRFLLLGVTNMSVLRPLPH